MINKYSIKKGFKIFAAEKMKNPTKLGISKTAMTKLETAETCIKIAKFTFKIGKKILSKI